MKIETYHLDKGDVDLCVKLAGCSLAETPGENNWVEKQGGLPEYICEVARAIKRSGKSTSQAIAIAVSRMKAWISDPDTDADTKAKASKALAQWEKMKAKSGSSVKASAFPSGSNLHRIVELASREFSTETREDYADEGVAMEDGSFPIPDKDALRRAIMSFGRGKGDKMEIKEHICKRAKALGAEDMLPDEWKKMKHEGKEDMKHEMGEKDEESY